MRHVKQSPPPLCDLPGIALTGFGMEEDLRQSREAGFEQHLTKPVNFQTLERVIRKVAGEPAAL
jgi:CheY-like chemotaxis protein